MMDMVSRVRIALLLLLMTALIAPLSAFVHPPKLVYDTATLPNGLRVILSEDHSTPSSTSPSGTTSARVTNVPGAPASRICSST